MIFPGSSFVLLALQLQSVAVIKFKVENDKHSQMQISSGGKTHQWLQPHVFPFLVCLYFCLETGIYTYIHTHTALNLEQYGFKV